MSALSLSQSTRRRGLISDETLDTNQPNQTTDTNNIKNSFKDKFQSLGIAALIILIIVIGFQMTDSDVYNDIKLKKDTERIDKTTTPSPTHMHIELIVHEDDGDVEVDVPQQIPPDLMTLSPTKNTFNTSNSSDSDEYTDEINEIINQAINSSDYNQFRQKMLRRIRTKQDQNQTFKINPNTLNHRLKHRSIHIKKQKPLINIRAPYHDSAEQHILLPSIEQMSQNTSRRFYSDINKPAQIYGYDEQCHECPRLRYAIISGLYNTGTNVAYRLIKPNCMTSMKFQPGWGKHEMFDTDKIKYFNDNHFPGSPKGLYDVSMLIIVIKDPLTWFKSMCKANYDFKYMNRSWFFNTCPQHMEHSRFDWFPMNRGKKMNRGLDRRSNGVYESPIHLWNEWYSSVIEHVNGKQWPHIIVRFEDLLFRASSVVQQFCTCLGHCKYRKGVDPKAIEISDAPSKPHGHPRNRTLSFWAYSNPQYRYEGYNKNDLHYMLDTINHTLLETFGYEFNVEKTLRMRL